MGIIKGSLSIIHSLVGINTSNSTQALSAGKGKDLEQRIETHESQLLNIENKLTRVGMVGIFTQSIAPAGVLYYNGASPLRADFPYLWQWAQDQGLVDNANAAKFGTGDGSTTFRLPDWRGLGIRGSGISSAFQMANGAYYNGGALMGVLLDAMQGHRHNIGTADNGGSTSVTLSVSNMVSLLGGLNSGTSTTTISLYVGNPRSDGTNGPPRNSTETRGVSVGIHFGVFYE